MIARLHDRFIADRRAQVLTKHLSDLIPQNARVLDIGCGDGEIDSSILKLRHDLSIEGIDVLVRPHTAVPVRPFDGSRIPYPDRSFDVALMVDVLHHSSNPRNLLREASRIADIIVIKDHLLEGFLATPTLRLMDFIGNAHHGVALPFNYLSEAEWTRAFEELGLVIEEKRGSLGLYPAFASWMFERKLHFIARLRLISRHHVRECATEVHTVD